VGALGQMVRASGSGPEPDARTEVALPPLEEYHRVGAARTLSWGSLSRDIISLLWKTRTPWGAYGLAETLGKKGSKKHPNSVYRSMRNLEAARLVIPIVSWSRYIIVPDPGVSCWGVILCSECRSFAVVAMPDEGQYLWSVARGVGFRPTRSVIECISKCQACSTGEGRQGRQRTGRERPARVPPAESGHPPLGVAPTVP